MLVHHIGYAVKDINKSIVQFKELGYEKLSFTEDKARNVEIAFLQNDKEIVELIAPINNGEPSALGNTLKKKGVGPYHICYSSDNLNVDIQDMENRGFRVIVPPEEACAIDGKKVVFMWSATIGMIEIVER